MVMGRLMFGYAPLKGAGEVPAGVPKKVPSRDVLLQGPFPADLRRGIFFSNSTASSTECVSICLCSFPIRVPGSCSLFTLCARGVNHLSPIEHQVDPKLIAD